MGAVIREDADGVEAKDPPSVDRSRGKGGIPDPIQYAASGERSSRVLDGAVGEDGRGGGGGGQLPTLGEEQEHGDACGSRSGVYGFAGGGGGAGRQGPEDTV